MPAGDKFVKQKNSILAREGEATMKKIIMLVGFATLLASPAFAQSYCSSFGTGNIVSDGGSGGGVTDSAMGAFAYVPSPSRAGQRAKSSAEVGLFKNGQYIAKPPGYIYLRNGTFMERE
jgi:hypothetical protein